MRVLRQHNPRRPIGLEKEEKDSVPDSPRAPLGWKKTVSPTPHAIHWGNPSRCTGSTIPWPFLRDRGSDTHARTPNATASSPGQARTLFLLKKKQGRSLEEANDMMKELGSHESIDDSMIEGE